MITTREALEQRCKDCGDWLYVPEAWECHRCERTPLCNNCGGQHDRHPSHRTGDVMSVEEYVR